jgi:hypothetical protein
MTGLVLGKENKDSKLYLKEHFQGLSFGDASLIRYTGEQNEKDLFNGNFLPNDLWSSMYPIKTNHGL